MSSEFKIGAVNGHGYEESELSSLNEEVTLGERPNATDTILDDIRKQGNGSVSNGMTNSERRAFTDR